jgi:predicted Zn finger-like uncharacterized protein
MLIVCPSCASEYTIDPANLGADGRTVRCAICRDAWFVAAEGSSASPGSPTDTPTSIPPPDSVGDDGGTKPGRDRHRSNRGLVAAGFLVLAVLGWYQIQDPGSVLSPWLGVGRAWVRSVLASRQAALEFRNVTSELTGGDVPILVVEGEIANTASHPVTLPHLEILVRNGDEQVLATWTNAPPRPTLGPGEVVRFDVRLASPPPDGRQVRVHFTRSSGVPVASR